MFTGVKSWESAPWLQLDIKNSNWSMVWKIQLCFMGKWNQLFKRAIRCKAYMSIMFIQTSLASEKLINEGKPKSPIVIYMQWKGLLIYFERKRNIVGQRFSRGLQPCGKGLSISIQMEYHGYLSMRTRQLSLIMGD